MKRLILIPKVKSASILLNFWSDLYLSKGGNVKPGSLLFRHIGGLILAVAAVQSWAAPITLVELSGVIGFSCGSGNGGFEKLCSGGENIEAGPFRLVYESSVSDTDPRSDHGLFEGAIKSFSMTISQTNRPDLDFSLVGEGDFIRSTSSGDSWLFWKMILEEENNAVAPSEFEFRMFTQAVLDPNTMPATDFWATVAPYGGGGAGASETDWLRSPTISVRTDPHLLPAPPSLWLLLLGAAAAFLQRGRLRTR